MKICIKCGTNQDFDSYFKRSKSSDGYENVCKVCKRLYKQEHYQKNKEVLRQKNRAYVEANRDFVRAYRNKWQKDHPEKMRDSYLWHEYRIRLPEYLQLLDKQSGVCQICKQLSNETLAVDHDHLSGDIRGLLCRACNTALGLFNDSVERLQNAITYLA